MDCLRRGDRRVHARRDGPRDAPAALFLNSLGTDMRLWDPLRAALPSARAAIRLDKPGHGLSDPPSDAMTMDAYAEDALAALDFYEIDRVDVVGLSIGGMIAQAFAARAPDRVRSVSLIATGCRIGDAALWDSRTERAKEETLDGPLADESMKRWFSARFYAEDPRVGLWRRLFSQTTLPGYLAACAALRDADLFAVAATIAAPTLCVSGDEDGSTPPATVRAMADAIPGATYVEIAGSGHLPCVDNPDALAAALTAHWAKAAEASRHG